jgi:hypothetical protein
MAEKKTIGIKMVGVDGGIIEDNLFSDLDIAMDIDGGKNNLLSRNKIIQSGNKQKDKSVMILIIKASLGVVGTVLAGLILYYIFGIK